MKKPKITQETVDRFNESMKRQFGFVIPKQTARDIIKFYVGKGVYIGDYARLAQAAFKSKSECGRWIDWTQSANRADGAKSSQPVEDAPAEDSETPVALAVIDDPVEMRAAYIEYVTNHFDLEKFAGMVYDRYVREAR